MCRPIFLRCHFYIYIYENEIQVPYTVMCFSFSIRQLLLLLYILAKKLKLNYQNVISTIFYGAKSGLLRAGLIFLSVAK